MLRDRAMRLGFRIGVGLCMTACSATKRGVEERVAVSTPPPVVGVRPAPPEEPSPAESIAPASDPTALAEFQRQLAARYPDFAPGDIVPECGMHRTDIRDADIDPNERLLVTVSDDKTARLWHPKSGAPVGTLRVPGTGMNGALFAVAVSPDAREVAAAGWDGNVYLFDATTLGLRKVLPRVHGSVDSLRYSRDGKRLAIGFSRKGGIRILDSRSHALLFEDPQYGGDCYGLDFNKTGHLAVASWDRSVRLYAQARTTASVRTVLLAKVAFETRPHRVAFDPSGQMLLVGFLDQPTVRVLSIPDLGVVTELTEPSQYSADTLGTVAWAKDGSELFAAGRYRRGGQHSILRWSRKFERLEDRFLTHNTPERLAGLSAGRLLVASQDPLVGVLGAKGSVEWSRRAAIPTFTAQARTFRASADAAVVQVFWDTTRTKRIAFDVRRLGYVAEDALPPLRMSVTSDPTLALDHWENLTEPTLGGRPLDVDRFDVCRALSIDPRRRRFALGCEWNLYFFDAVGTLLWQEPLPGSVRAQYLSEDGGVVVVAMDDGTIRWFDTTEGNELLALLLHDEARDWVAWTLDGFYAGTLAGERLLGIQGLSKDGSTGFVLLRDFADVMRRPDLVSRAPFQRILRREKRALRTTEPFKRPTVDQTAFVH